MTKTTVDTQDSPAPTTAAPAPDTITDPMAAFDYLSTQGTAQGDGVGLEKLGQVKGTDTLEDGSIRDQFFVEAAQRHRQAPEATPWKVMGDLVFKNPSYQARGMPIPSTAIEKVGGNRRVAHMGAVYKYNLEQAFKETVDQEAAESGQTKNAVLGQKLGERQQAGEGAVREVLSGQIAAGTGTAWWAASDESGAVDLGALKSQLALEESQYADGAVRFNLTAEKAAGKLRRPTPFDGMGFKKWAPTEGGSEWGLTAGGLKEAIAEGIPVSDASSIEVLTS